MFNSLPPDWRNAVLSIYGSFFPKKDKSWVSKNFKTEFPPKLFPWTRKMQIRKSCSQSIKIQKLPFVKIKINLKIFLRTTVTSLQGISCSELHNFRTKFEKKQRSIRSYYIVSPKMSLQTPKTQFWRICWTFPLKFGIKKGFSLFLKIEFDL